MASNILKDDSPKSSGRYRRPTNDPIGEEARNQKKVNKKTKEMNKNDNYLVNVNPGLSSTSKRTIGPREQACPLITSLLITGKIDIPISSKIFHLPIKESFKYPDSSDDEEEYNPQKNIDRIYKKLIAELSWIDRKKQLPNSHFTLLMQAKIPRVEWNNYCWICLWHMGISEDHWEEKCSFVECELYCCNRRKKYRKNNSISEGRRIDVNAESFGSIPDSNVHLTSENQGDPLSTILPWNSSFCDFPDDLLAQGFIHHEQPLSHYEQSTTNLPPYSGFWEAKNLSVGYSMTYQEGETRPMM